MQKQCEVQVQALECTEVLSRPEKMGSLRGISPLQVGFEFFVSWIYTHKFRHSVLHGRNPNYDNAEDSMKLVMLLRALREIGKNC